MTTSDTAIAVSSEVREKLHNLKSPGDSYDSVIRRELLEGEATDA